MLLPAFALKFSIPLRPIVGSSRRGCEIGLNFLLGDQSPLWHNILQGGCWVVGSSPRKGIVPVLLILSGGSALPPQGRPQALRRPGVFLPTCPPLRKSNLTPSQFFGFPSPMKETRRSPRRGRTPPSLNSILISKAEGMCVN